MSDKTARRVSAGPYTIELPSNGVATLYEADAGGNEHQLPGGVGYLDALVQFAGEVIRLCAMLDQMQPEREFHFATSGLRARGVGRVADEPRALLVLLTGIPADDDIRALHDWLVSRLARLDAEWRWPR